MRHEMQEWIIVENSSDEVVSLAGHSLTEEGGQSFAFGSNFALGAHGSVTVWSSRYVSPRVERAGWCAAGGGWWSLLRSPGLGSS